jgi:uncharacterized membrane protein YgcG
MVTRCARRPRLSRLLGCLAVALAVAAPTAPSSTAVAADKPFRLEALATDATVLPDASMQVTEQWTYRFEGGPFNFGIRSFEQNTDQIADFTASDEQGPLTVIAPDESVSGDWEWQLREPTSDRTITFTVGYRVIDALRVGADVADLNWMFLGTEHPGVGDVRITVRMPGSIEPYVEGLPDDDATVLRGWAHGPTTGTIVLSTSQIVAAVAEVPAGQFVEIRAAVPATVFSVTGDAALLPDILAQERGLIDKPPDKPIDTGPDRTWLARVFTPILAGLGALGAGLLWRRHGREPRSTEVLGDYWREPLDDPPAIAISTLGRGRADPGPMIAGTLTDLAQRGFLSITAQQLQRRGPDTTVHHYQWRGKPTDTLHPFEWQLLQMVFRGRTEADSGELTAWAQANRTQAKAMIDAMTADVRRLYSARDYDAGTKGRAFGVLAILVVAMAVGSAVLAMLSKSGVALFGVAAAVATFAVGATVLRNRTQAGAEAYAKAAGLKRYIKDFSQLADAPVGHLILWERFLVYSVAFGVSAELMRGLAVRLPQVMNDPTFTTWYIGAGIHRFDGFSSIGTQTAAVVAAAIPNSSGAGGGFSGGGSSGGGGGGGGGAGAR